MTLAAIVGSLPWTCPLQGLPLHGATDPAWTTIALDNLDLLLQDHAHCEHKAASTALGLITRFPTHPQLARPLLSLAQEEMTHFREVLDHLQERHLPLPSPSPDLYVRMLRRRSCSQGPGIGALGEQLLASALVEARSCERFRLLAQALPAAAPGEPSLADFYRRLAIAEARHWETFHRLAASVLPLQRVTRRLEQLGQLELEVLASLPVQARMH